MPSLGVISLDDTAPIFVGSTQEPTQEPIENPETQCAVDARLVVITEHDEAMSLPWHESHPCHKPIFHTRVLNNFLSRVIANKPAHGVSIDGSLGDDFGWRVDWRRLDRSMHLVHHGGRNQFLSYMAAAIHLKDQPLRHIRRCGMNGSSGSDRLGAVSIDDFHLALNRGVRKRKIVRLVQLRDRS